MLTITAQNEWYLKSTDIKTAFLQGKKPGSDVYLQLSSGSNCPPRHLWKLDKCVHGLSDASLKWYTRITKFVTENNKIISNLSKFDVFIY